MTITVSLDNLVFITGLLLGAGLTSIMWFAYATWPNKGGDSEE